jgi:uncharacterized repeat protein (TIGR01451 family)
MGVYGITQIQPDLALDKTANPSIASAGSTVTFTIVVSNSAVISATNALISDTLPSGLTFFLGPATLDPPQPSAILATAPMSLPALARNVTIAAGTRITLTFPVTLHTGLADGALLTNTAAVTSTLVTTPVSDVLAIRIENVPGITVTKAPNVSSAYVGQTITYTYRVTNSGNVKLAEIAVRDDKLGAVIVGTNELTPGEGASGTLTYTIVDSDLPGPLTNTVTVSGTTLSSPSVTITATNAAAIDLQTQRRIFLPLLFKDHHPGA